MDSLVARRLCPSSASTPIFCSKFAIKKQLKNRHKTPLENAFLLRSKMTPILLKGRHYSVTVLGTGGKKKHRVAVGDQLDLLELALLLPRGREHLRGVAPG